MKFLFWFSIIISGIISISGFAFAYFTTSQITPTGDNNVGGNGNVGLIFILFSLLIIIYFFLSMIFVFEKIHNRFTVKKIPLQFIYFMLFIAIISLSAYRIILFHDEMNPYFDYELSYLNPFSNDLFFNFWTFSACICLSGIFSFYSKKGSKKTPFN